MADLLQVPLGELLPGVSPLRILRIERGLSVPALAARVKVSERTVHRWEAGHYDRAPAEEVLARLSGALAVTVEQAEVAFRRGRR